MSIQCNTELFPETLEALVDPVVFEGEHRCKFGHATVVVKLLPSWSYDTGLWTVGWFCLVDRSVDEWMPGQRTHVGGHGTDLPSNPAPAAMTSRVR